MAAHNILTRSVSEAYCKENTIIFYSFSILQKVMKAFQPFLIMAVSFYVKVPSLKCSSQWLLKGDLIATSAFKSCIFSFTLAACSCPKVEKGTSMLLLIGAPYLPALALRPVHTRELAPGRGGGGT